MVDPEDRLRLVGRGCGGSCNQGRTACDCDLANAVPPRLELVRSVPSRPPIQMTRHRTSFARRVGWFLADLWAFITAPRFRP